VDIISLALRVAMLESVYPPIDGPLMLDEPAKHVSEEYTQGVGEFIEKIEEAFGRQIILITHNQDLAAGGTRSYQFSIHGGKTEVRSAAGEV
jgi:DNA repair exonuclease SbcCD ATPase subunit